MADTCTAARRSARIAAHTPTTATPAAPHAVSRTHADLACTGRDFLALDLRFDFVADVAGAPLDAPQWLPSGSCRTDDGTRWGLGVFLYNNVFRCA